MLVHFFSRSGFSFPRSVCIGVIPTPACFSFPIAGLTFSLVFFPPVPGPLNSGRRQIHLRIYSALSPDFESGSSFFSREIQNFSFEFASSPSVNASFFVDYYRSVTPLFVALQTRWFYTSTPPTLALVRNYGSHFLLGLFGFPDNR